VAKEAESARIDRDKLAEQVEACKQNVQTAMDEATLLVTTAVDSLTERASRLLPSGSLYVHNEGDDFRLGWTMEDDRTVLRGQMSGYEGVVFDAAIGRAIGGDEVTVFVDAGECSNHNLDLLMRHVKDHDDGQVVLARWTDEHVGVPDVEGWTKVML